MIRLLAKGETPAWRRLLAPFRYLAIRHDIKPRYDWGWPFVLTVATMVIFWLMPVRPPLIGDTGILKGVLDLIALFAAFFVAALAAVATFERKSLDLPMQGTTPTLDGRDLSRRQFICYLFGYLAVLSFALFLSIVSAQIVTPSLVVTLSVTGLWWVKAISGTVFAFAFWNMIVTTLLGIYFLVERVNLDVPVADGGPKPTAQSPDGRASRRAA
jgi:apolipoprotein N-acyltransferase